MPCAPNEIMTLDPNHPKVPKGPAFTVPAHPHRVEQLPEAEGGRGPWRSPGIDGARGGQTGPLG